MAFPSVVNSNTTNSSGTASLALNMPASIVAGNLLLNISTAAVNDASTTAMSGWTSVTTPQQRSSGTGTIAVWGKIAAGADTGTVTGSSAVRCCITYQISGWSGSLSDLKAALLAGSTSAMDPPALTPGFGALDYLWIAIGRTNGTQTPTVPFNYTGSISSTNGTNLMTTGQRSLNATSEDPGQFGGGVGNGMAGTVAVKPVTSITLSRTISETVTGTDARTSHASYFRAVSDAAVVSDVATRSAATSQPRSVHETLAARESVTFHRSFYLATAAVADIAGATDEGTPVVGSLPAPLLRLSALVGDTGNVIAIALNKLMTFPPTTPTAVNTGTNVVRSASISETLGASDHVTSFTDQKLNDTAHASDAAAFAYVRGVFDGAAAADVATAPVYLRDIFDVTASTTDSLSANISYRANTSDAAFGRLLSGENQLDVAVAS